MNALSAILDVIISLSFIYLLLSIICTAVVEYMEVYLKKRGRFLWLGMLELLATRDGGSDGAKTLVASIYDNPLVYGLYKGEPDKGGVIKPSQLPSYIPANTFVLALLDEVARKQNNNQSAEPPKTGKDIATVIAASAVLDVDQKRALTSLLAAANDDYNEAIKKLETWYDTGAARVSGWYRKHTQKLSICIATVLVLGLNVDTLAITQALMVDDTLRNQIVAQAAKYVEPSASAAGQTQPATTDGKDENALKKQITEARAALSSLGLPIGWDDSTKPNIKCWLMTFIGWVISAIAISFGAPFWFDVLNKVMQFRTTLKPEPVK